MKKKNKSYFIPSIYLLIIFSITIGLYFIKKDNDKKDYSINEDINYVSGSIFNRTIPIINVTDNIVNPFDNSEVKVARYFYHKEDENDKKNNSLVYYDNTYMPNTGVDYTFNEVFDIVSIYNGTVIDTFDDELLGKTVHIRHNNDVISVYQGLGEVLVSKGDVVFLGQKIGTSGTSKINASLGNHLHFEIYKNGELLDPLNCIGKVIGDI